MADAHIAGTRVGRRRAPRFRVVDLGAVEGNHNMVQAINNAGHIVGSTLSKEQGVEAFVSNGKKRLLGSLGGVFSSAHGINNSGQIVGGSLTEGDGSFHAFLFMNGGMYDLNDLIAKDMGWELVQAVSINDRGQIIGVGMLEGKDHVFVLDPVRKAAKPRTRRMPPTA